MTRQILLISTLLFGALPSYSALVLTLTPPVRSDVPSDALVFSGTILNSGPADVFLNGIFISFTPPAGTYLSEDQNFFSANVGSVLLSGESYIGPIFRLPITPNTPPGTYSGTVSFLGGGDELALDALQEDAFSATLATPEPATLTLISAALGVMALRRRRTT